jgi:hypothetical protein
VSVTIIAIDMMRMPGSRAEDLARTLRCRWKYLDFSSKKATMVALTTHEASSAGG